MKTNIRTLALLLGATLLGTILFTGTPAAAVNITNTVDEALLTSSNWNSSVWGTPAAEPLPTTNYFIGFGAASSGNIRTVSTTAAQSFNGAALQINNGKTLFLKHANGVATVSLLSGGGGPSTITYAGGASGTNCPLGGTLTLNNSLSIGSNQGANSVPIWVLSPISGTANLTVTTNATVVLFGTNRSYTGKWIINNGASLQIGSGTTNALGSGNVTNNSGGSLAFNSANNFTVTNLIVGAGSVIKQNTGTVTLTGASTFAGTVQVSGGVLQIDAGSSLAAATNITLFGGTLSNAVVNALPSATTVNLNGGTLGMGASATVTGIQISGVTKAKGTWGAVGNGSVNHTTSAITGTGILTVTSGGQTAMTVTSDNNSVCAGSYITFTATVTGSTGDGNTPSGTVTFKDNGTTIGTGTLSGSGLVATATYATSSLTVGTHANITASYAGNASYDVSTSTAYSQTVNPLPAVPTISSDVTPATVCAGSFVTLTATAPGAAHYSWSSNGVAVGTDLSTYTTTATEVGTYPYSVTIQDANGCQATSLTTNVTVNALPSISSVTPVNVTCNGANNGSITVSATISAGTVEYSTNNGSTWQGNVFTGLAPGNYNIVVRNATVGGCPVSYGSNPVIITEPTALAVAGTATNNVTCNGSANGSITVLAANGTAPYIYSKDNFATTNGSATFGSLTPGNYTITAKDANGCTQTVGPINISEPSVLTVAGTATNNVTTHGGSDGSFTVTPSGGSGVPYGYSTNNGTTYQGSSTFSSLTAGTYNVTITNGAGCTASTSVTVTEPSNSAPIAGAVTVNRNTGLGIHISVRNILTNHVSDADSDPITLVGFTTPTYTNLVTITLVSNVSNYFFNYPATTNVDDRFEYWVTDGHGNYATNSVNIHVVDTTIAGTPITGQLTTNTAPGTSFTVKYFGVISNTYVLQRSTNLAFLWVNIATNQMPTNPPVSVIDTFQDLGSPPSSAYYRVALKP